MKEKKADLLQGTLDLLVLKALTPGPLHGLGVSQRIEQITKGTFQVKPGSLFPALHRMEEAGWVRRRPCPSDRRGQLAELTDAGMATLEAAAPSHVEEVRSLLFDGLSRDQQQALLEVCDAIVDHITDHNPPWPITPAKGEEGLDDAAS